MFLLPINLLLCFRPVFFVAVRPKHMIFNGYIAVKPISAGPYNASDPRAMRTGGYGSGWMSCCRFARCRQKIRNFPE